MKDAPTDPSGKPAGVPAQLLSEITAFLRTLGGEAVQHVGATLGDWAAYYRYRNLLEIKDRVTQLHRARGVSRPVPLDPKTLLSVIDAASRENESELQGLWAALLAGATDPERCGQVRPSYIEVLRQLSSDEAVLLKAVHNHVAYDPLATATRLSSGRDDISQVVQWTYSNFLDWLNRREPSALGALDSAAVDNLVRLHVLEVTVREEMIPDPARAGQDGLPLRAEYHSSIFLTPFGRGLLDACVP